jgi:hypothetical protein
MKKLIHAAVAVACLSGLAGCVTAAQQVATAQDKTCRDWGLKPGTDALCQLPAGAFLSATGEGHRTRAGGGDTDLSANENVLVQQQHERRPDARHAQLHVTPS